MALKHKNKRNKVFVSQKSVADLENALSSARATQKTKIVNELQKRRK